jgi:cytochrome c oxidase subunit 3
MAAAPLSWPAPTPAAAHRQAHFSTAAQQSHAARLGMWLFLATEILLFAGLFVAYGYYRSLFAVEFAQASRELDRVLGTIDTLVLIVSSFSMAMSVHFIRTGRPRTAALCLLATVALGLTFLGLHAHEYAHDLAAGHGPGRFYRSTSLPVVGASMFYCVYYLMTGLHSLHVAAGCTALGWLAWRTFRQEFSAAYLTPVELGGMYWHLVDSIWIFLYPLLYLL